MSLVTENCSFSTLLQQVLAVCILKDSAGRYVGLSLALCDLNLGKKGTAKESQR